MEPRLVALGALLLFISSLTLLETGVVAARSILYLVALASLALAVGSLLTDIHRRDRPTQLR